jgi:uncharacterized protein (TIGR02246 family)
MGEKPSFVGGRNIALKVPSHVWGATVEFYRDIVGLKVIEQEPTVPPSVCFEFGANQLWIDRVDSLSQAEIWLELHTSDVQAAAGHLKSAGIARRDEIEPLSEDFEGFWITSPASIIHLVSNQAPDSAYENEVGALYRQLLASWNERDAEKFATLFDEEGHVVGFDGSVMNGRAEISSHLQQIFADHPTAAYVGKIREVRLLAPEVALLRAVVGMVPPGQSDLNPAVNTIQTLVAANHEGRWRITLFQNTPAQFHGRPELAEALTEELRQLL